MKSLDELNAAVKKVIDVAQTINNDCTEAIYANAPSIVYQKVCGEVVDIAKKYKDKSLAEIEKTEPELTKLLSTMDVLERLYPELIKKLIKEVA